MRRFFANLGPGAPPSEDRSIRFRIRCGGLAQVEREDPDSELERREPEELFRPLMVNPPPRTPTDTEEPDDRQV